MRTGRSRLAVEIPQRARDGATTPWPPDAGTRRALRAGLGRASRTMSPERHVSQQPHPRHRLRLGCFRPYSVSDRPSSADDHWRHATCFPCRQDDGRIRRVRSRDTREPGGWRTDDADAIARTIRTEPTSCPGVSTGGQGGEASGEHNPAYGSFVVVGRVAAARGGCRSAGDPRCLIAHPPARRARAGAAVPRRRSDVSLLVGGGGARSSGTPRPLSISRRGGTLW